MQAPALTAPTSTSGPDAAARGDSDPGGTHSTEADSSSGSRVLTAEDAQLGDEYISLTFHESEPESDEEEEEDEPSEEENEEGDEPQDEDFNYDRMREMREESIKEDDEWIKHPMPLSTREADESYWIQIARCGSCGNGPRTTGNGLLAALALPDADGLALHRVLQEGAGVPRVLRDLHLDHEVSFMDKIIGLHRTHLFNLLTEGGTVTLYPHKAQSAPYSTKRQPQPMIPWPKHSNLLRPYARTTPRPSVLEDVGDALDSLDFLASTSVLGLNFFGLPQRPVGLSYQKGVMFTIALALTVRLDLDTNKELIGIDCSPSPSLAPSSDGGASAIVRCALAATSISQPAASGCDFQEDDFRHGLSVVIDVSTVAHCRMRLTPAVGGAHPSEHIKKETCSGHSVNLLFLLHPQDKHQRLSVSFNHTGSAMSIIQRFKAFIKSHKGEKDKKSIQVVFHAPPVVQEAKEQCETAIEKVDPVSPAAEVLLPQYLSAAMHDPEVLGLRPSLGLPHCHEIAEPTTPSSAYTGRTLFITNDDPSEQSVSTAATSLHSSLSTNSSPSCSSRVRIATDDTSFPLRLYDFLNIHGLGAGGFGAVYLAKHKPTGLTVALKVIDKRCCDHKAVRAEQRALVRIASQSNRGILEFLGSFHNSRHYFFVTSYYSRGDLKAEIRRWGRLPLKLVKFYGAELLLALQTVHDAGVVHRDVKPDNIFLKDDGHLVLGDFGLAASIVPPGETFVPGTDCKWFLQDLAGTLNYLSPEMWKGEPYSFSADVWAFGVVIFEMLFGRTPWKGSLDDPSSVIDRHMEQDTLDEWLADEQPDKVTRLFLEGMLEKDMFDRPTLDEARTHPFFGGISWNKLARGEIPVPQVGCPPNKVEKDPDVFFGSFGGGGVYMGDEDPLPQFNFISPTLVTSARDCHSCLRPVAPSSSSCSFEDIPLNDNEGSASNTSSPATCTANLDIALSQASAPADTASAPVVIAAVSEERTARSECERKANPTGDIQMRKDLEGPARDITAVQHKRLTVLTRLATAVGKALQALKRMCSVFPPHH
ncbi:hypothetical protein NM688_g1523 [Phlebia brevispora]|uniref:Uncharacterized protein n=1 Tax=Phlebia brevispora TaxID=194682 RepID=A0ACC1TBH6_9APHY|nr:hypothetical protein NM688_g1523 [Phlebia brevispora]